MHAALASAARVPRAALVADIVSWGYAFVAVATILGTDAVLSTVEAVAVTVLFLLLRAVAREVRREASRQPRIERIVVR